LNHLLAARVALSGLCLVQAIATVAIDFNRTHATNPHWPGHARFHIVWQGSTIVILSALELFLMWWKGPCADERFYLAALFAAASPLGFVTACASRKLFGGTLSDPNGIPPARLKIFGSFRTIDINVVAVLLALASLFAMVAVYRT